MSSAQLCKAASTQQDNGTRSVGLTEVLECLFDLLGGQVEPGVRRHQGRVEPVIVVVAVDGVGPQPVDRQLLLQEADDLELWQVGAVADI